MTQIEYATKQYITDNYHRFHFVSYSNESNNKNPLLNSRTTAFSYDIEQTLPHNGFSGYTTADFSFIDNYYLASNTPDYSLSFLRTYHIPPCELNYQKYIIDIRDFTTRKMFDACQRLKKCNDVLVKLNNIDSEITKLKKDSLFFFTSSKKKMAIWQKIEILCEEKEVLCRIASPARQGIIPSRHTILGDMRHELDVLEENITFLNNLNVFILKRTNSPNDSLYIPPLPQSGSTTFSCVSERENQSSIIRLENLMCQQKLIETHNKWSNVFNKRKIDSYISNEEEREIDCKIERKPYKRTFFGQDAFVEKLDFGVKSHLMTEFEEKEIKKQKLGRRLYDYATQTRQNREEIGSMLYVGVKNEKDKFTIARQEELSHQIEQSPKKNILERFISWIRS